MSLRRALGLLPALFLLACSSNNTLPSTVSLSLKGNVHGGQQPITNASVQLYAVGLSGGGSSSTPLLTTPVATNASGGFSITGTYSCPTAGSQVYVVATGGNPGLAAGLTNPASTLAAALGPCGALAASHSININEVTTVALASSLAAFTSTPSAVGSTPSDAVLLDSAFANANQFASTTLGTSPGADLLAGVGIPSSQINTLANVLATCVNSAGGVAGDGSACGRLFSLTSAPGVAAPVDTFSAALRIADNPSLNTSALFATATPISPFKPDLAVAPASFAIQDTFVGGLQLSKSFLAFGPVSVNASASSQSLTLTNPGPSAVALSSVVLTGINPGDFTLVNGCPAALAASASCTLQIGFQPPGSGRRVAALAIANDSSPNTLIVELSGAGIAPTLAAPTLTSLAPASLPIGTNNATITLSGTGFSPSMIVTAGNTSQPFQYLSPQSATVNLSYFNNGNPGYIPIVVRSQAGISNTLNLAINNPAPVLSSLNPTTVLAGASSFTLNLAGSNFGSNSTVLVNGVPSTTTYFSSSSSLNTVIQASQLTTPGTLSIAVTNPAPGGGTSAVQSLQIVSTPNRFRTLNDASVDIVSDPVRELLYAAVVPSSGSGTNSVIAIDPVQGAVVGSAPLASTPTRLAISDDGSLLYVASSDGKITRLKLPSLTQDISFIVSSNSSVGDIQVAPGSPHTIAVSVQSATSGMRTVSIYDDAVARPLQPGTSYPSISFDTLAWGNDATTLFATNAVTSGGPEFVFSVDAHGANLTKTLQGVLGDFDRRLYFNKSTQDLYDGYGAVVAPGTGTRLGILSVQNTLTYEANDLVVDAAGNRAFFLNTNYFAPTGSGGMDLQSFNLTDFTHVSTLSVQGMSGSRIVRWGNSGLAVAGGSQIFLVDGSFIGGSGPSVQAGSYAGVEATIKGVSPQTVPAGNGPVDVVITGTDLTPAAVVTWNGHTLPVSWQSATQVTVTLPAVYLTTAVSAPLSVTNGPGTEISNTVAFAVLPDLGPNLHIHALDVSGQEMVWDSTRSLLYVAVTNPAAPRGSSVVAVDPAASTITSTLVTGGSPYTLDVSGDGQYLYVGFEDLQVVNRYKLDDGSLALTIPLTQGRPNQNYADSVRVAPGSNQTIAVSAGSHLVEPGDTAGLTIFDGATPRPNRSSADMYKLTWGKDATQLIGNSDPGITPQNLLTIAVSSSGLSSQTQGIGFAPIGLRPHYDPFTNLVYADDGAVFDPSSNAIAGVLISGGLMVPDGALNRAFVLRRTDSGPATYALDIFNQRRQTLLKSIPLPAIAGNPTQILRWGTDGLAILTDGPGLLYMLQGTDLTGQSTPPAGSVTLNPANVLVNTAAGATITVTGAAFQPASVALVNGVQRPTAFVSSTQLTFQLAAPDQTAAHDLAVSVDNLAGGGSSPESTLEVDNPAPTIGSLSSSMLSLGASDTVLTVSGTGFLPTTIARINGNPRTSTYISPTSMSLVVQASDLLKITTLQLALFNAGPGGGVSAPVSLQVGNPQPVITYVSPASVTVGAGAQTVYLTGSGFNAATVVTVNGAAVPTTLYGGSGLQFSLPASTFVAAGSLAITATNPAPGGGVSAPSTLSINSAPANPIQLSPSTVVQGATTPATITVTGTNFIPSSVVLVSGQSRTTTYLSGTQLTFRLTPADYALAGLLRVTVVNPVLGGGTSSAAPLTVLAASATPVISSVSPTQFVLNSGLSYITVSATGVTASTTVLWNGSALQSSPSPSSGYVTAQVPASLLSSVGTATITLSSPSATPSLSNAVNVSINVPATPKLTSLSPRNGPINTGFTVTVDGSGFTQDSVVLINGHPLQTTFQSTGELTASVPASEVAFGNDTFTVSIPQAQGGVSAPLVYTAYVPQASNTMLFNSNNGLFYLSVPGSAGAPYGNSVVSLDPVTGALGTPIFVGSEPNHMALSSDGHYLWVSLDGVDAVRKVDLFTGTAGLQFGLAAASGIPASPATALATIPGQLDAVIVSVSGTFGGSTIIFDNGVPRPTTAAVSAQALQVDSTRGEVYAAAVQSYYVLNYNSSGITKKLSTTLPSTLTPFSDARLQVVNGRTYSDAGSVIDSETGAVLGSFSASPNAVSTTAIDPALGLAFTLDGEDIYGSFPSSIQVFNLSDFTPSGAGSIPVNLGLNTSNSTLATELTRWGVNGLAVHTSAAIFAVRSNLVKALSSVSADLSVTASASGASSTGANTIYTAQITNNGPSSASEVLFSALPPATGTVASVTTTNGSCTFTTVPACSLGTLSSGASANVTLVVHQLNPGTSTLAVQVSASESDPDLTNNRAAASTTISGTTVNPSPALLSLSPSTILAGTSDTTVTLSGTGFVPGSVVLLDGTPLPTSVVSSAQISATVPASSLASLGWHALAVATPAPGGGTSSPLALTVYSVMKAGLSRITYDPYTRRIIGSLGPATPTGNSIEFIHPETGSLENPIPIGSEPTRMALTDDGQILYVLLTGSNIVQRFNMLTLQPEFGLNLLPTFGADNSEGVKFSVQPGSENTLALAVGGFLTGQIADFTPSTQTAVVRSATTGYNSGANPQFLDATHVLVSGSGGIDDYTLSASGFNALDKSLTSFSTKPGPFEILGKQVFTAAGAVQDFSSVPAVQLGAFPVSFSFTDASLAVDPALSRTFFLAGYDGLSTFQSYGLNGFAAFDNKTFLPAGFIPMDLAHLEPTSFNLSVADVLRWGQDGIAALTSSGNLYLVRGPAVLPQLLMQGTLAPTLTPPAALSHSTANSVVSISGSNFQPGMAAQWNGSYRTTNFLDASHATILVPASDLANPGSVTISVSNPGSQPSNTATLNIN